MAKCKVKIGDVYNFLKVEEESDKRGKSGELYWKCLCTCGNYKYITSYNLTSGHTKSCGCYAIELSKQRMIENSREYLKNTNPKKVQKNEITIKNGYVEMICSQKKVLLDIEDYSNISNQRWFVSNGYCCNSKGKYLHRIIMTASSNEIVDHINGNKLDNRKCNLRFVTKSQNGQNRKCKGVTFDKKRKKWAATIVVNRKKYFLGRYNTEQEALLARKNGEVKLQGEYRYNGN